ncbi:MAG: hypothetical protein RL150_114 [Candidatus Parcubacteria bacterium]
MHAITRTLCAAYYNFVDICLVIEITDNTDFAILVHMTLFQHEHSSGYSRIIVLIIVFALLLIGISFFVWRYVAQDLSQPYEPKNPFTNTREVQHTLAENVWASLIEDVSPQVYIDLLNQNQSSDYVAEQKEVIVAGRTAMYRQTHFASKEKMHLYAFAHETDTVVLAMLLSEDTKPEAVVEMYLPFLGQMFFGSASPNVEPTITYNNATADQITVELPYPGAVTGKEFTVIGKARGYWFFEASFPVELQTLDGAILGGGVATAQGDWMTEDFVPFTAEIQTPSVFIGPAILILKKDNPSGEPENDASISFPIVVEY